MGKFNYYPLPDLVPQELIDKVAQLSPAQLCDGMKGLGIIRDGCMDGAISPVSDEMRVIGTAATVDTEGGDNLPIHVALYQCTPGYVLIIDGKAYTDKPYFGDLIVGAAKAVGLTGMIVDGYIRDKVGIRDLGLPVFTRGFMPRGPGKSSPGAINVAIHCGGVIVNPGDLVVGDYDGVAVIPRDKIEAVIEAALKKDAYEKKRTELIAKYEECKAQGKDLPDLTPDWVKDMMAGL